MSTTDLIIAAGLGSFFLISAAILLYQLVVLKRTAWPLFAALIFGFFGALFRSLAEIFSSNLKDELVISAKIIWLLMFLSLFMFFSHLEYEKPHEVWSWIVGLFSGTYFILAPVIMAYRGQGGNAFQIVDHIASLSYDFAALTVFGLAVSVYLSIARKTNFERTAVIQLVSVAIAFIGFFLAAEYFVVSIARVATGNDALLAYRINSIIPNVVQFFGLIVFTISILTDIDYLYRLPFDVNLVLITRSSGAPVFSYTPETKHGRADPLLFSGLITALAKFTEEISARGSTLETVHSGDVSIHVLKKEINGTDLYAVVTAEKITYYLKSGMKNFFDLFIAEALPLIKDVKGTIENELETAGGFEDLMLYQLQAILRKAFPYFHFDKDLSDVFVDVSF